jgi:class 3 adenylate cyclase
MRGLFIHVVVYAVVNALLVGAWLLTTGSTDELRHIQDDPLYSAQHGFWPLIVATVWAGALVIHAGVWVGSLLPSGRRRRRVKAERHEWKRHQRPSVPPAPLVPATPWAPPAPGAPPADLAKHAAQAAIGLVESLAGRAASRPSKPPTSTPGRHWVAVMFTDLVGSTGLAESLGDATWHEMLASHRQLVRQCLHDHQGTEVGTQGDGFLVRFELPDAAVSCAVALQRQMGERRNGGSFVPELRVGIHAGEAVADDNDLVGRVINLAARVTDAAEPGEILITEPVADHLSPGVALVDRGLKPLKGFAQPRHLLAVAWHPMDETIVLTTAEVDDEV